MFPSNTPGLGSSLLLAEESILNWGSEKLVEPTLPLGVPTSLLQEKWA